MHDMHDVYSNYTNSRTHTHLIRTSYTKPDSVSTRIPKWPTPLIFIVSESQENLLPLLPPHSGAEGEAEAPRTSRPHVMKNGEMADQFRLVKYNPDGHFNKRIFRIHGTF